MRWLLWLFFTHPLFAEHQLTICAIFKNEGPFLKEWIEFHQIQGVEHFFLYNNNSEDQFREVLAPYIANKTVSLIEWPFTPTAANGTDWVKIQKASYMNAIEQYGAISKWMAFIDIDEFLFCPTGESLVSFLSRYEEFGGVVVNWLMFGTSHIEDIPQENTLTELLTMCSLPSHHLNARVKTIVQPHRVTKCRHAHCFRYKDPFFAVNCDYLPSCSDLNGPSTSHDKIRINHYWTRTEKHFREQKIPSQEGRRSWKSEENLRKRAEALNQQHDFAIQQFIPELKKRLFFKNQTWPEPSIHESSDRRLNDR